MKIELLGTTTSPYTRRVRVVAHELGVDLTLTPAMSPEGDARLRTLLMMVMRNHNTDSPWPVSNNPRGLYNQRARADCNLNLPLWQLVRASTAAPTYFPPEVVVFGKGSAREYEFIFVDGGITGYNNPAFLAFEMATAAPYRMLWPTGTDQLLIDAQGNSKISIEDLSKALIDELEQPQFSRKRFTVGY